MRRATIEGIWHVAKLLLVSTVQALLTMAGCRSRKTFPRRRS